MDIKAIAQGISNFLLRRNSQVESPGEPGTNPPGDRNELNTPVLENPDETAEFVRQMHDDWARAREPYEAAWYTNLAFYAGHQWLEWNKATKAMREPKAPSYRARYTSNRILPTHATRRGKLNRGTLRGKAIPLQQSETAFSDARVVEKLLRALHSPLYLTERISEAVDWQLLLGNGFFKVGWDPSLGQRIQLPDGTFVTTGEIYVDAFGSPDIFVPPDIKDLTRPCRIIHATSHDLETLRAWYPDTAVGLEPDDPNTLMWANGMQARTDALLASLDRGGASTRPGSKCYTVELSEDPEVLHPDDAEQFPNGRVTVLAYQSGKVLSQHENPFTIPVPTGSRTPIVMMRDDTVPGKFWAMSRYEQLVPIQKNYNKGRSQIIEARNLTCQPKINREKNDEVGAITNEPGQTLARRPGAAAPAYMTPPVMSDYMVTDLLEDKFAFQEISQISEASRGQLPHANTPGIAIDMLQQADNTPLGPLAVEIAGGVSRMLTKVVERAHQFYDEPRVLTWVGDGNEEDVFTFHADAHPTPCRVEVPPEQVIPNSPAAMQAKLKTAAEMMVVDPIKDRLMILRALEIGSDDVIFENDDLDRQQANRENRKMLQGLPAVVEKFQNHEIHIYQHDRVRKGPEWETLPPELKDLINLHCDEHLEMQAIAVTALSSMGPEPAPPGMPGEPGAEGPPGGGGEF